MYLGQCLDLYNYVHNYYSSCRSVQVTLVKNKPFLIFILIPDPLIRDSNSRSLIRDSNSRSPDPPIPRSPDPLIPDPWSALFRSLRVRRTARRTTTRWATGATRPRATSRSRAAATSSPTCPRATATGDTGTHSQHCPSHSRIYMAKKKYVQIFVIDL